MLRQKIPEFPELTEAEQVKELDELERVLAHAAVHQTGEIKRSATRHLVSLVKLREEHRMLRTRLQTRE
jgi:hypothetical protein